MDHFSIFLSNKTIVFSLLGEIVSELSAKHDEL